MEGSNPPAPSIECVCGQRFDTHEALHQHINDQTDPFHQKVARRIVKRINEKLAKRVGNKVDGQIAAGSLPGKLPPDSNNVDLPFAARECVCGRKFGSNEALLDHVRGKNDSFHEMILEKGFLVAKETIEASRPPPAPTPSAEDIKKQKEKWLFKDIGQGLTRIQSDKVKPVSAAVSSTGPCELLCSYSWAGNEHPTAYVPGEPPRYITRPVPISVPQDSGAHFIDQNSFRLPDHPFEIVFQAMQVMNPTFKFDGIDVLVNRNSLRHLFNFCLGKAGKSFRVGLFMVHNTLVIERNEESAKNMIHGAGFSGYGHNFEKAVTVLPEGMEDSVGHHRVLRYDLGGLNCAVRFEVDASFDESDVRSNTSSEGESMDISVEDLSGSLEELQVEDKNSAPAPDPTSAQVIARGAPTPNSQMAEIKSMSLRGTSLGKLVPQLWFGRTPYLIRGHHTKGKFSEINVDCVGRDFVVWERKENNQLALRKMVRLLGKFRGILKNSGTKAGVVVYVNEHTDLPRELQVFAASKAKAPLPEAIIEQFWEG